MAPGPAKGFGALCAPAMSDANGSLLGTDGPDTDGADTDGADTDGGGDDDVVDGAANGFGTTGAPGGLDGDDGGDDVN